MKFTIQKNVLQEALQAAISAVPNKSTIQILNNFSLRLEGNFESIKDDPSTVEAVGAIFEIKKQVAEIEQKLNKAEGSSEKA